MVGRVSKTGEISGRGWNPREKREKWYARTYRVRAKKRDVGSRILVECIETAVEQEEPQGRAVLRLSSTD